MALSVPGTVSEMLSSEKIELRALQTEDALLMYKWYNDGRVTEDMDLQVGLFAPSLEEVRRSVERSASSFNEHFFIIQKEGRAIGFASLSSLDEQRSSAQLTVVIGESMEWDKGRGKEATRLVVGYAFNVLNLHRVHLRVAERNMRAIACFEACGFVREGTLRDDHHHRGTYSSSHVMSVLREETSC